MVERSSMLRLTKVPSRSFRLAPADVIEIRSLYHPDYADQQQIRPDGNISLFLVGDVKAANKTPSERWDAKTSTSPS